MVVIPAGSFRMGSPSHERWRNEAEGPVHEVTIDVPFALGRYEVTVAEFGRFVDETGHSTGNSCDVVAPEERTGWDWRNPNFSQNGRHPVVCVHWNDAQAYAAWLSRRTGREYRLPSESEWEYAARAGTATARPWDESEQCQYVNGADASFSTSYTSLIAAASCRDGHVHTAPVGSFDANGWGLHDMLGNVGEWTDDCLNDNYVGAPSDGSAWKDGDCGYRMMRGGSWMYGPSFLRLARRFVEGSGNSGGGFRVARTLAP